MNKYEELLPRIQDIERILEGYKRDIMYELLRDATVVIIGTTRPIDPVLLQKYLDEVVKQPENPVYVVAYKNNIPEGFKSLLIVPYYKAWDFEPKVSVAIYRSQSSYAASMEADYSENADYFDSEYEVKHQASLLEGERKRVERIQARASLKGYDI